LVKFERTCRFSSSLVTDASPNAITEAPALCLWCFDLLSLDGVRLMPLPLSRRKAMLANHYGHQGPARTWQ
jgi:ATP-dependent DNA ligase